MRNIITNNNNNYNTNSIHNGIRSRRRQAHVPSWVRQQSLDTAAPPGIAPASLRVYRHLCTYYSVIIIAFLHQSSLGPPFYNQTDMPVATPTPSTVTTADEVDSDRVLLLDCIRDTHTISLPRMPSLLLLSLLILLLIIVIISNVFILI